MRYVDSFSQEEINVILTRIFDGWMKYKVNYNCAYDNYWVSLGYLFTGMISYNSRPDPDLSVLARMRESKQIMIRRALPSLLPFSIFTSLHFDSNGGFGYR